MSEPDDDIQPNMLPERSSIPLPEPSVYQAPPGPPPADDLEPISQTQILGPIDAYAAVVVDTFDAAGHPVYGMKGAITARRCDIRWGVNNEPTAKHTPVSTFGSPVGAVCEPFPFPARHDQAAYIVSVGDIVTVLEGRDGRRWYMSDELPFLARVLKSEGSAYEMHNGGAGLTKLKVR